ncbi:MAG: hypothetical protein V1718_05350 [archaeon]
MPEITPIYVRDKLVECFVNTNRRMIKEQAKKKGKRIPDKDIERQLKAEVKKAFERANEDFSNPRKESFPKVMALLRSRCASMPEKDEEEIMEHIHEIMDLVNSIGIEKCQKQKKRDSNISCRS